MPVFLVTKTSQICVPPSNTLFEFGVVMPNGNGAFVDLSCCATIESQIRELCPGLKMSQSLSKLDVDFSG
jgi:hypothetical protein